LQSLLHVPAPTPAPRPLPMAFPYLFPPASDGSEFLIGSDRIE
jgi:hypothetical protein